MAFKTIDKLEIVRFDRVMETTLHVPRCYQFDDRYYGMTAVLRPLAITKGPEIIGPMLVFKVGLAFTSPLDQYIGRIGEAVAAKRLDGASSAFELIVPLSDLCRGRLLKFLKAQIDLIVPPFVRPEGITGRARDYGFPIRLLFYRHAHRPVLVKEEDEE